MVKKYVKVATIEGVNSEYIFIEFRLFQYYYCEETFKFVVIDFELDGLKNSDIHKKHNKGH